jgi:hypothetical protein
MQQADRLGLAEHGRQAARSAGIGPDGEVMHAVQRRA